MKTYFITYGFGYAGCEGSALIKAGNEEQALDTARHEAITNAEAFGFYQDQTYFGNLDEVGRPLEEEEQEEEEYEETGTLEYTAVEYVPEIHDDLL